MLNKEIVNKTIEFLYKKFDESEYLNGKPESKAYRIEHSFRVANIGRQIAEKEGFDETETVVACLLHDISYCETFGEDGWINHGRRAAKIARPFLEELGFPKDRIDDMCYGIAIHVDDLADFEGERTPFALTVGDADNIDRFDAYRIHETLCAEKFLDLDLAGKTENVKNKIAKLKKWEALTFSTEAAEQMWRERITFYLSFYEKLSSQLNNSKGIYGLR